MSEKPNKSSFLFVFPSGSTFGEARGTDKWAQNQRKTYFSLVLSSGSTFNEVKGTHYFALVQIIPRREDNYFALIYYIFSTNLKKNCSFWDLPTCFTLFCYFSICYVNFKLHGNYIKLHANYMFCHKLPYKTIETVALRGRNYVTLWQSQRHSYINSLENLCASRLFTGRKMHSNS